MILKLNTETFIVITEKEYTHFDVIQNVKFLLQFKLEYGIYNISPIVQAERAGDNQHYPWIN